MEHMMMRIKQFVPFFLLLLCLCSSSSSSSPSSPHKNPTHFVLVHGAGHGAWCWYKVAALLTSIGHNVTALDLAASGIDTKPIQEVHSLSDYIQPLMAFMASLPPKERVVLVGHSMGGSAISAAMESFPERVSAAVFATAAMPGPDLSYKNISDQQLNLDLIDVEYRYDQGPNNPPTSVRYGPKSLASMLYQNSPPEDLALGLSLVRFHPVLNYDDIKFTKEKYGSVPRVFIVSNQDRAIGEDVQRWMTEKNPPNEVKVINGSDHMVMLSRPVELFSHLHNIAEMPFIKNEHLHAGH